MSRLSWIVTIAAVLGLPLLALYLGEGDISFITVFPPEFGRVEHAPFEPKLTLVALFACALVPGAWLILRRKDRIYRHDLVLQRRHFPKWGYWGYFLLVSSWLVAWNRYPFFTSVQIYTFTPVWLGFIVVVNAHVHRRSNTAPIYKAPGKFAALFVLSALFWWVFEYLNRFTENWVYGGVNEVSAWHYYIHGSICFSTVLPAVYSVFRWLNSYNHLHRAFYLAPRLPLTSGPFSGIGLVTLGLLGLIGVGLSPQFAYPWLWVGPLLVYGGMQLLLGKTQGIAHWIRGDWRWVAFWGLAGLICGFFWELWNFYSLLRWEYQVSFFNGWEVFEMPILGYLGYLPFGVLCGLVTQCIFKKRAGIEFSPND